MTLALVIAALISGYYIGRHRGRIQGAALVIGNEIERIHKLAAQHRAQAGFVDEQRKASPWQ